MAPGDKPIKYFQYNLHQLGFVSWKDTDGQLKDADGYSDSGK